MLILFLVIVTSTSTMKHLNILSLQKDRYEDLYIAVLNTKEKLYPSICKSTFFQEGDTGKYTYKATCTKVKELKNFIKDFEDDKIGNLGDMFIQLYKVDLVLKKKTQYNYTYYISNYTKSY